MLRDGVGFYAFFGYGWWLAGTTHLGGAAVGVATSLGAVITVALLVVGRRLSDRSAGRRLPAVWRRRFVVVNAVQWLLIAAAAGACGVLGVPALIAPLVAVIVGGHFMPLATLFERPSMRVPGMLLVAVGLAGVVVWVLGAAHPVVLTVVGVGCALTLWGTAVWSLAGRTAGEPFA